MERHWPPSRRARNLALHAGAEHCRQHFHGRRLRRNPHANEERTHGEVFGRSTEADAQAGDLGHKGLAAQTFVSFVVTSLFNLLTVSRSNSDWTCPPAS